MTMKKINNLKVQENSDKINPESEKNENENIKKKPSQEDLSNIPLCILGKGCNNCGGCY